MKLHMLWSLVIVAIAAQSNTSESEVKGLERLEAVWNDAHVRSDTAALDPLFAEDLIVIVPGMRAMTKADALGVFKSGQMKFDRYDTSETKFRVFGDAAIVTGRLRRSRVRAGATVEDDWQFSKVYVRRGGRWQVVLFHASATAAGS